MSRDANSEEIGAPKRVEGCASWEKLKNFDCRMVNDAKQILDPRGLTGNWISLMLCVTSISIDPLFFYIPVIHSGCLDLDTKLGIIAFILRSAVDLIYMICVFFQLRTHDDNSSALLRQLFCQYLFRSKEGYIDLLAVLPLPQVVIMTIVLDHMGIITYYNAMNVLKYFVYFQFVPRVIRIYPLLKKATGAFGILGEVTWAKAAFNLYLYLLSGHAIGALWYFYAIERANQCWYKYNPTYDFDCDGSSSTKLPPEIEKNCSTKSEAYDFGIYKAVLEPEVIQQGFVPTFMYCFRWGVQSLSCFAENLQTSADTWENIFTIMITIVSLVLFVFLIGNMQLYIQSGTSRSEETKQKMREILHWMAYKKLDKDLQQQVEKHQLYVWKETKGVDIENSLNNLPTDLRRNIKSELGLKLLQKVPNFQSISEQRLNAMCERLKHVLYSGEIYIVRKNDPVVEMLFFERSKLLIDDSSNDKDENFVECQSEFCGDELSTWAQNLPSSPNLPISKKNIKTATEGVEAFALTADDLKYVFTQFA